MNGKMKIQKIAAAFMAAAMAFGSSGAVSAVVTSGGIQTVLKNSDSVSPVKKAHAEEKTSATMKAGFYFGELVGARINKEDINVENRELYPDASDATAIEYGNETEKKAASSVMQIDDGKGNKHIWAWLDGTIIKYWSDADVIYMNADSSGLFAGLNTVTSIDLSHFNTSNVKDMSYMFRESISITSLDASSFDTSKVTNMKGMFAFCYALKSLNLSSFDTSNVKDMSCMFYYCSSIDSLDVSKLDTSKVTDMKGMFAFCYALKSLNLSSFDTSNVKDMSCMFYYCSSIDSLDVSNFDTSNVTNMYCMFEECFSLTSLDLSNFNTSNVTDMVSMFNWCRKLISLDVSKFDTSKVIKMSSMFRNCSSLTELNVSSFNVSNVTDMGSMFAGVNAVSLDLSNFDTSNVTNMRYMFDGCENLEHIYAGDGWNTSKVKTGDGMFGIDDRDYNSYDRKLHNFNSNSYFQYSIKHAVIDDGSNGGYLERKPKPKPAVDDKQTYSSDTDSWDSENNGQIHLTYDTAGGKWTDSKGTKHVNGTYVVRIPRAIKYEGMNAGTVSASDSYDVTVEGALASGKSVDVKAQSGQAVSGSDLLGSITETTSLTDGTAGGKKGEYSDTNYHNFTAGQVSVMNSDKSKVIGTTVKDNIAMSGTVLSAGTYTGSVQYSASLK